MHQETLMYMVFQLNKNDINLIPKLSFPKCVSPSTISEMINIPQGNDNK